MNLKFIYILLISTFIYFNSVAQGNALDSLSLELKKQKNQKRVDVLNELAWHYRNTDPEEAIKFANLALKESENLNYSQGKSTAHRRVGTSFLLKHNYKNALDHFFKALKINESLKNWKEVAKTHVSIGNTYMNLSDFENADRQYKEALNICISHNEFAVLEIVANNIGATLENFGEYEDALAIYRQALQYSNSNSENSNYSNLLLNLGSVHFNLDELDSALYYNQLARARYEKSSDSNGLLKSWINEALFHESFENYTEAIKSYKIALPISNSLNDYSSILEIEQGLMLSFGALGLIDSMYTHFENSLEAQYILIDSKTDKALQELSVQYDVEKRKEQLKQIEKEKDLEKQRSDLKQETIYYLIAVIGIIALLLIILYLFYLQKQKSNRYKVKIANQEIEQIVKNQELNMYRAQTEGQERERKRIAEDLHDRIGGLLATINLQFEGAELDPEKRTKNIRNLVDESIKEVRNISHNLSDGKVENAGLVNTIQGLQGYLNSSGKISLELFAEGYHQELNLERERELYKIILELISNALKHAEASNIIVQLNSIDKKIQLMFEDNGKGFDIKQVTHGLGLRTIEQRVLHLEGVLTIDSRKGFGTTTIIEIPEK